MNQKALVSHLREDGVLKSPQLIAAFLAIDRSDFVPAALRVEAYADRPLPIGYGQTISQPWTVAFMLELLQPHYGQNVLDVGSGSGWQTALLAAAVSAPPNGTQKPAPGHVTALELIPQLCEKSRDSLDRYGFIHDHIAEVHCQDATYGFSDRAPYDRIIVAAMTEEAPGALTEQLAPGGIMVLPMRGSVWQLTKQATGQITPKEYPGFAFVPFVHEAGKGESR